MINYLEFLDSRSIRVFVLYLSRRFIEMYLIIENHWQWCLSSSFIQEIFTIKYFQHVLIRLFLLFSVIRLNTTNAIDGGTALCLFDFPIFCTFSLVEFLYYVWLSLDPVLAFRDAWFSRFKKSSRYFIFSILYVYSRERSSDLLRWSTTSAYLSL